MEISVSSKLNVALNIYTVSMKYLKYAALILVILFCMSIASSYNVLPHSLTKSTLSSSNYEGFSNLNYTTYPENASIDTLQSNDISPMNSAYTQVGGFGLLSSPNQLAPVVDTFSQAKGSPDCKSYGLMNSTGYLCLDANQQQLLTTRGGNAGNGSATSSNTPCLNCSK